MALYLIGNGPMQTTAAFAAVTTGTSIKTLSDPSGDLVLATLAQRWKMRHVQDHQVATQAVITLRPKYGMRMSLEER